MWVERIQPCLFVAADGAIGASVCQFLLLALDKVQPSVVDDNIVEEQRVLRTRVPKTLQGLVHTFVELVVRAIVVGLIPHRGVARQEKGKTLLAMR